MIRIFLMSVRFGIYRVAPILSPGGIGAFCGTMLVHHFREAAKQIVGVVRAGRGFRMILHAEERERAMPHAFIRVVIQVDVRDFHLAGRQ